MTKKNVTVKKVDCLVDQTEVWYRVMRNDRLCEFPGDLRPSADLLWADVPSAGVGSLRQIKYSDHCSGCLV